MKKSKYNGQYIDKMLKKDLIDALITLGHAYNEAMAQLEQYRIRDKVIQFNSVKPKIDEYGDIDNNLHAKVNKWI